MSTATASVRERISKRQSHSREAPGARELRQYLRLYLYPAFTWRDGHCMHNLVHFVMFILLVLKVAVLTTMMIRFGKHRAEFTNVVTRGHLMMKHQLLKSWTTDHESVPYPPGGTYAIYSQTELKEHINYAVNHFYRIEEEVVGQYSLPRDSNGTLRRMELCVGYHSGIIESRRNDTDVKRKCFPTRPPDQLANGTLQLDGYNFSVDHAMMENNLTDIFDKVFSVRLTFALHSLRVLSAGGSVRCLVIDGYISFDDPEANGQVLIDLQTLTSQVECREFHVNVVEVTFGTFSRTSAVLTVFFTVLSLAVATSKVSFGLLLLWKTHRFVQMNAILGDQDDPHLLRRLSYSDYMRFFNLWDVVTLVGDTFIMVGTYALEIETSIWTVAYLDKYTMWLGLGCLLAWGTLLRYFKFHSKFNLLFATLYHAFWDVLAYVACVAVLYFGYLVAGHVVIGPYHFKFETVEAAGETLLALINGDEIYATLSYLQLEYTSGPWMYAFMRVFIGSYVALFTIVVLNLLVAIFMSAYDRIQELHAERRAIQASQVANPLQESLFAVLEEGVGEDDGARRRRQSLTEIIDGATQLTQQEHKLQQELLKFLDNPNPSDIGRKSPLKRFIDLADDADDHIKTYHCGCMVCSWRIPRRVKKEFKKQNVG